MQNEDLNTRIEKLEEQYKQLQQILERVEKHLQQHSVKIEEKKVEEDRPWIDG